MSKNQFGNNLLYILSEKKSVKWSQFFQYVESLNMQDNCLNNQKTNNEESTYKFNKPKNSYLIYSFSRNLNSLGYLDIGEDNKGNTIVKIAPPMLVELPFIRPTFLLTGARSPELLKIIKNNSKIEVKKTVNKYLPDNITVRPENIETLETWLEETVLQGNRLSSYIKVYKNPVAWSILELSGKLKSYNNNLKSHWFSGNKSDIQTIFDVDNLSFKTFNIQKSLKYDLSLVKISHYESFHRYYLFNFINEDRVKVNLDWGRFLIAEKLNKSVLEYNSQTFELVSFLRLPLILERGLTLLSGTPPRELNSFSKKQQRKDQIVGEKVFVFKNVSHNIATLVADKLGQKLKEMYAETG